MAPFPTISQASSSDLCLLAFARPPRLSQLGSAPASRSNFARAMCSVPVRGVDPQSIALTGSPMVINFVMSCTARATFHDFFATATTASLPHTRWSIEKGPRVQ
eukprot:Mycagemm_TRINITY_DN9638_c0_g1::TRINITY_DN9638_c0_g1_i1::g.2540::m.2540 type:complete len:104 gc:universal TRINITY_DN9638_c0_g1_i1:648-337(-)